MRTTLHLRTCVQNLILTTKTNERINSNNMHIQTQTVRQHVSRATDSKATVHTTPFAVPFYNAGIRYIYVTLAVLALTNQSFGRAANIQTLSAPSPLLGNAAAAVKLFNSTISVLSTGNKVLNEANSIQRQTVKSNLSQNDLSRSLKRVHLSNRSITCNDGTYAGFYLRKNQSSKKWIVFLEGGWHCYDTRSCKTRWLRLRHLMTSTQWPETRDVGGILSPLPEENPYWHNANHVLVPYCSSDSWSGTRVVAESRENNWKFMGALILRQVIADLIPLGLGRVSGAELILVGSSAGGLGVMLNLDRITSYLVNERNIKVTVRGISDSGWFLDREPYIPSAIASSDAVRQGWKLWQGLLPEECSKQHTTEPWRCYFGYRLYPTLKSPLFVFQWLFDEAQMRADNVGAPVTPQQWNFIHQMGGALRSSLDNVSAVFAPSCIGHAVLSKRDWVNIKIDDISLPSALRCWEHSTRPRNKHHEKLKRSTEATIHGNAHKIHQNQRQPKHPHKKSNNGNKIDHNVEKTIEERRRRRHENQRRREEKQRKRKTRNRKQNDIDANIAGMEQLSNGTNSIERRQKHRGRNDNIPKVNNKEAKQQRRQENRRRRRKGQQRKEILQNQLNKRNDKTTGYKRDNQQQQRNAHQRQPQQNRRARVPRVPEKCALRLLERCSWPQCNYSCPTLTNPLTGEEMRFLELLTSFGLDIEAVATALGVDMHTLNNMDRTELVNLLTQQVS